MDLQVVDNWKILDVIFGSLYSFDIEYDATNHATMVPPYYPNTVIMDSVMRSGDCGVVNMKIYKQVSKGSPLSIASFAKAYVPKSLQPFMVKMGAERVHGDVNVVTFRFRIEGSSFNQLIMEAYQDAFDKQFTETLESKLELE